MSSDAKETVGQALALLQPWYLKNRSNYPWRTDPTPYHVWLSEIMLQQTRIEAALPYYNRFLSELPGVAALAACPDDKLMKLWQGLGYYSRARNLKAAAVRIVENFGGMLPDHADALRSLPGIGDYTAGAIASIAFGLPEPAVDGNVLRVVMRLLACSDDISDAKTKKDIAALLRSVYPQGKEARFATEGLMELGEKVCIPNGAPRCASCPLASICRGYAGGSPENYPQKAPKKSRKIEKRVVLLLFCNGKYALKKRPESGLLAGLYEFPNYLTEGGEEDILRDAVASLGCRILRLGEPIPAKHIFTHIEWDMVGYRVEVDGEAEGFLWLTPEEIRLQYAVPSAFRAFMKIM